ncbi:MULTISPECIES: spore germination protein [Priestia]|nr:MULTISPECIES: spore germination protein [Priestia]MCG0050465.1 spore germination protein [Priestia aryabhattai]QDZ87895.1 spore germination protein [Priestia megaterium]
MPSVVGAVNISSLSGSAPAVTFGDCFKISPKSTDMTKVGAGSGNTGNFMNITNEKSTTNTKNGSIFSQNIVGNL